MNSYDHAHALARSIKEAPEYQNYIAMKDRVNANPELADLLSDFQQKQFQFQAHQMMGGAPGPEMMEQIQSLYSILAKDPLALEYLQAEMNFSRMVQDIYVILGDVIKIGPS